MDEKLLMEVLAGLPLPQVRAFAQIGSTNDEAIRWAAEGAGDGCLVIADQQSQGRGRFNRRWVTNPGVALAFSLILRPTEKEWPALGLFSPLGALAICRAVETLYGLAPEIKWPNDVLLERRKVSGILAESAWVGDQVQSIVLGIGINVAPEAVPPTDELLFPAISIEEITQQKVDRFVLLREVLREIFAWRERINEEAFNQEWNRRLAFRGKRVHIRENGGADIHGQVIGVDRAGSLLLRGDDGEQRIVVVGDLHLRPE